MEPYIVNIQVEVLAEDARDAELLVNAVLDTASAEVEVLHVEAEDPTDTV